jgi:predicted transcriptional regulator
MNGVYLQQLKTAIINEDGTGSLRIKDHPGIAVHKIDLRNYYNSGELAGSQEEIAALTDQLEDIMGRIKSDLGKVQESRKLLANNYEDLLNAEKLQDLSQQLITEILGDGERATHYFARAITSDGVVDFFEEITGSCTCRYILQGPPGSGKSWLMRRIGEEALSKGHRVGFYHSGLDPDFLEMVVLDSLQIALADGDIVRLANRPGDCHINLIECWDNHEQFGYRPEIREAERVVSDRLYQAIEGLTRARQVEQKLSKLFTKAMKFDQVDTCRDELVMEILDME